MAESRTYSVVEGWEQLPAGYEHRDVAGVAVDGEDRVFLICRGDHPVLVYDQKGNFLALVGRGPLHGPHPRHHHRPGRHRLLHRRRQPHRAAVHARGQAADDAGHAEHALGHRLRRQGHEDGLASRGAPFNRPTNLAVGPKGDLYVSDGYGNCRVHQFSPTGKLKRSWGVPGQGPRPVPAAARHRRRRRRAGLRLRSRERSHPDLQPRRRVSQRVDRHPPPDPRGVRRSGPRPRLRAVVATGPDLAAATARPARSAPGASACHDGNGNVLARWGGADPTAGGQLRRAARHRGGLARGRLRERGDLDLRGQPRPRPARHATRSRSSRSDAERVGTAERWPSPSRSSKCRGPRASGGASTGTRPPPASISASSTTPRQLTRLALDAAAIRTLVDEFVPQMETLRSRLRRGDARHRRGRGPALRVGGAAQRAHRDPQARPRPDLRARLSRRRAATAAPAWWRCPMPRPARPADSRAELGLESRVRRDRRRPVRAARGRPRSPDLHRGGRARTLRLQRGRHRHHRQLPRIRPRLPAARRAAGADPPQGARERASWRWRCAPST